METQSLATLINGSLVTLNDATLNTATNYVYISYITHITCIYCILQHLLHVAYTARTLLIHSYMYIFSFTPLDLCVLGSCWGIVRLLIRYYCTVGTRSTKHFATLALTSANHVYVTNKITFDLILRYTQETEGSESTVAIDWI